MSISHSKSENKGSFKMAKTLIPKGYKWALCISHDVDHLKHYFGPNLAKFWGVSFIELLYGRTTFNSFAESIKNSFNKKSDSWNQAEILASINRKYKIPATFFFAVKKGKGIEYGNEEIEEAISKLSGFEIGVHGQSCTNIFLIEQEFGSMRRILGKPPIGMRMHYLRWAAQTADLLKRAGYLYDSTEFNENLKQPYKMYNGLVEIPLHIMDTYFFSPFYRNFTLTDAKEFTLRLIARARKEKKVLNILFHLRHLAPEFQRQRDYYLWLLELSKNDKTCYKISLGEIAKKL